MTNQQFLTNFYLQYDKVATLGSPGYTPEELSIIATEAQEILVVNGYKSNNSLDKTKEGFEETEYKTVLLNNLLSTITLNPLPNTVENLPNGLFFQLPNTLLSNPTDFSNIHWLTVYESVLTDDVCNPIKSIINVTHNEIGKLDNDPFNKPKGLYTWRVRVDKNRHELITDGSYKIKNYFLRYLRKPIPIDLVTNPNNQVSELSDITHRELLRITTLIASKDIQDYEKVKTELETNNTFKD